MYIHMQDSLRAELSSETDAHLQCGAQLRGAKENVKSLQAEIKELKHDLTQTLAAVAEEQTRNSLLEVDTYHLLVLFYVAPH